MKATFRAIVFLLLLGFVALLASAAVASCFSRPSFHAACSAAGHTTLQQHPPVDRARRGITHLPAGPQGARVLVCLARASDTAERQAAQAAGRQSISRREGDGSHPRLITSATPVRFRPLHPSSSRAGRTPALPSCWAPGEHASRAAAANSSTLLEIHPWNDRAARSAGNMTPAMAVSAGDARSDDRA